MKSSLKSRQKIGIVGAGALSKRLLLEIVKSDYLIGVDRGALWLLKHKIVPDVAIGDFDSVTKKDLQVIKQNIKKVIEYPQNKDATDLELAVDYAISLKPKQVIIFGGIGTRLDHTMVAVHLLEKIFEKGIDGKIINERNEIMFVKASHTVRRNSSYHYVSVLPHTRSLVVTLTGFAYPLTSTKLIRGTSRGISNEIVEETAMIEVHEGIALVIKSRD